MRALRPKTVHIYVPSRAIITQKRRQKRESQRIARDARADTYADEKRRVSVYY